MDANEVWCPTCRKYHCWRPNEPKENKTFSMWEKGGSGSWTFSAAKTKTVWQWRYKAEGQRHWKVAKSLLTEGEAMDYYGGCKWIEKHAGPFEVRE